MDAQLLTRARQLVTAGPFGAQAAEVAAVHDTIWPDKAPVCPTLTCRAVLGRAYFAIKRWVEQQGAADDAPHSPLFMKKPTARFKSDDTIYTPHGLGVAYSNVNLTDKAARDILAADPDAAGLFDVLPPAATDDEMAAEAAAAQVHESPAAPAPAEHRLVPATVPVGFDYKALAAAMFDEGERRQREADARGTDTEDTDAKPDPNAPELKLSRGGADSSADQSNSTDQSSNADQLDAGDKANSNGSDSSDSSDSNDSNDSNDSTNTSTGGTSTGGDGHEGEKPVRLSRQNKDQLRATYAAELGSAPAEGLGADELREAIAKHRDSKQSNQ